MAGRVNAHLMVGDVRSHYWVEPIFCPAADDHRQDAVRTDGGLAPVCLSYNVLVGRRTCVYWYGMTEEGNACHRTDAALLVDRADGQARRQLRCGVLCMAQRRNRPPGV